MKELQLTSQQQAELSRWLSQHRVGHWDLVVFGDGSGTTWTGPTASATVTIEPGTGTARSFITTNCTGTNNTAEIEAYLMPLLFHARLPGRPELMVVHLFTDSEYVVKVGMSREMRPKQHRPLWAAIRAFRAEGMSLAFHHIKRDSVSYNRLCDKLAGQARRWHLPKKEAAHVDRS